MVQRVAAGHCVVEELVQLRDATSQVPAQGGWMLGALQQASADLRPLGQRPLQAALAAVHDPGVSVPPADTRVVQPLDEQRPPVQQVRVPVHVAEPVVSLVRSA